MAADVQIRFKAQSAEARTEIDLLKKEIQYLRQGFKRTQEAADGSGTALQRFRQETTAVTHVFVSSIDAFGGALTQFDRRFLGFHERVDAFTGAIRVLPPEITAVRSELDVLAPTAERVAAIFDNLDTSLVESHRELRTLDTVTQKIIQDLQDLEGLAHVRAVIAERTDVHNANLVKTAISDAAENMRLYIRVMDAVQDRFEETDTISDRLTDSIREQTSAFDDLRSAVDGVAASHSGLQGQQLGSGVFDQFDARTPGTDFGTSFADNLRPLQAQLGQELASQAIRTAGQLRRIEEERVESLEDLEREYSERIIEINERKRERLLAVEQQIEAERLQRIANIEAAFEEAAAAEVAAREAAAARIEQIEALAAEQRERLREQLNERLIALEQRRDDRIQDLNDGFIERELERQQRILEITERAAAARIAAEQAYADAVQAINNRLVEDVLAVQQALADDIVDLEAGFVQRQQERADQIVQITQESTDARADANRTFANTMQDIYNDLVTAYDDLEEGFTERQADRAEERIAIEQQAAAARTSAHQTYNDTVARISRNLVDDIREIQAEITQVTADAATQRLEIEQEAIDARLEANAEFAQQLVDLEQDRDAANAAYATRLARISTDLVDDIRGIQDEITSIFEDAAETRLEIEQDAITARAKANDAYADSLAEIEAERLQEIEDGQLQITRIQQEATEARLSTDEDYADRFQDIQNTLLRRVLNIQQNLNDTLNDLRDEQLETEQERLDSLVELHEETQQRLEDLERNRHRTLEDLRAEFQRDQLDAAAQLDRDLEDADSEEEREEAIKRYNRRIQDLTREFQRDALDLQRRQQRQQEDLTRQAAAREIQIAEQAQAEKERIVQEEATARTQAQTGIEAAESRAGISLEDVQADYVPALSAHEQALLAHVEALGQINQDTTPAETSINDALNESVNAAAIAAATLQQTLAEIDAAEQERLATLESQTAVGVSGLNQQIADAEARTGLSFDEALANYTPAVDLNTQALQALTTALESIADAEVAAGQMLNTALSAITTTEQERLSALETETSGTLAGLNQQITDAQTGTGLSFDEALANYTPAVDLNTQALQALTDALQRAESDRVSGLGAVDAAGIADRATTTEAQQALVTGAGVSIEDARANFVPALSSAAQATRTLNETMQAVDTSFKEALAGIYAEGLVDRQAVDDAVQAAIARAESNVSALETQAGTTFADASLAFQPGVSDIAQAGIDRDSAIAGIDEGETAEIDGVNAQSIADRLETDAAITETRDAYIKARDTEIFKHNTAMLQLNIAEAADIKAVRATLSKNLESIDEKLDAELAEIRDAKTVFDTRIGELIEQINSEANQDVTALKADTAAMRDHLNVIAEEAKNNEWKSALLKVANVGITIAGVAAGTALGNPVAGFAVGQVAGNLVEQGGNELLFHYDRTDAIARRLAQQETLRRTRSAPQFFPTQDQIRNARDVSREIVAGVTEGLNIGNRTDGGFGGASQQAALPNEISATIQIEFPDGSITELTDQIIRLRDQDRVNL